MSEDCILFSTKMMGDKGMDINGMNKIEDRDSPTKDDHSEHH
jgi:hypothetical protein